MHKDSKQKKAKDKGQVEEPLGIKKLQDDPYKDIRLGGINSRTHNWWEEGQSSEEEEEQPEDGQEWRYMEHHGVLFPAFYQRHNVPLVYDGKQITLTMEQEELCTYWTQTIGTDYENREHYRKNFTELMNSKFDFEFDLAKCDFSGIKAHLEQARAIRLARSDEVKKQEKLDKETKDRIYGYALVDGCLERVGSYTLEPPTLFKGRGQHPKAGMLKGRQYPEDLTINVSMSAPVPKCTMPGHAWGNIVCRPDVTWLVSYVDSSVRKDNHKYVQFAATSRFKQMNDKKKYEKARRLKACIQKVRADYMQKLKEDQPIKQRQLGTATYLIDKLALRVGNEKDDDEADTVGCCSLRVEHIEVLPGNRIKLDFLGKDSMRYENIVELDPLVCRNIASFIQGKKPSSNLFDAIQADDLNEYLKTQMKGLTAKVFRTYNASVTLQQQLDLKTETLKKVSDLQTKVNHYDEANRQVAILCNHQKTIPKSYEITKQKITFRIEMLREYVAELEQHIKRGSPDDRDEEIDAEPPGLDDKKQTKKKKPTYVKKFYSSKEKNRTQIQKVLAKIAKEETTLTKKEENKEIALGTSKTNYNDPRISVAWCKENDVPIERIFPKTLRGKFIWAMATDPSWKF